MVSQHNKFRLNYEAIAQMIEFHADYHYKPVWDGTAENLQEIEDYGYNVITEDFDLFDFDDDEWEDGDVEMDDDESLEIDEDELISFMNEFFLINNHVPPAEMF